MLCAAGACARGPQPTQSADHAHLAASSSEHYVFVLLAAVFGSAIALVAIALLSMLYEEHRQAEEARRREAAADARRAAAQARHHAAIDRIDALREAELRREFERIPAHDERTATRLPHRLLPAAQAAAVARVHDPVYAPARVPETVPPPPPAPPVYVYPVQHHPVAPTTVTRSAAPLTTPQDEVSRIANEEMRRLRDELAAITAAGDAWLPT